ncbi:hypothetical protein [Marininema halotolerans]|uniref:Uncharacterized protein n=1 Tax=Marininema halotolerans TaxID=1155944 RepID=A0A1I6SLE9_9BACL|nr:hypothetical protein [Marininema halotolerans]SFS77690.1 hypothetical protein SAMN05444972_107177 [Marininema halotolerans]
MKIRNQRARAINTTTVLAIPFTFYSDRVIQGFGPGGGPGLALGFPIIGMEIGLIERNLQENMVAEILRVTNLFNLTVGNRLNNKTLIQRGVPVPQGVTKPVLRVGFEPTIERTSRHVYNQLFPALRAINENLDYVTVLTTVGKATHRRVVPL